MTRLFAPLPAGPFGVVLADPPWRYSARSAKGLGKSADSHYATLPIATIAALPVRRIAAKDCALFLWCTWPTLFEAQAVIAGWGFTYSGLAWEWVKWNPATDKFAFGGGYGTRKNCEPCILAIRGNPPRAAKNVRDVLFAKAREHSRKPDEQFERIERLFPGPYVELFARRHADSRRGAVPATGRRGWTAWGNEAGRAG